MIIDELGMLEDDDAITVTRNGTNVIDLKGAALGTSVDAPLGINTGVGPGCPIYITAQVSDEDFASGTSIQASLQMDDNVGFSSPRSVIFGETIAVADLVQGAYLLPSTIPITVTERFIRMRFVVSGTMTAGKVTVAVTSAVQTNK